MAGPLPDDGGRRNRRSVGRLPVHGLRRAARHGRIGGVGGGAARLARRAAGPGRPAFVELGGRIPVAPHRAVAAARPSSCWSWAPCWARNSTCRWRRNSSGRSRPQAIASLETARERHFVWVRPDGVRCAFVHDKIRAALLARLSPEERQRPARSRGDFAASQRARTAFSTWPITSTPPGTANRPCPTPCCAAGQARSQHSLEVAEQQYRIADRGRSVGGPGHAIRHRRGAGRRAHAAGALRRGRRAVPAGRPLARRIRRGQDPGQDRRTGLQARRHGERHAGLRGHAPPAGARPCREACACSCSWLLWEVAVQTLHTLLPGSSCVAAIASRRRPSCWRSACSAGWRTATGSCAVRFQLTVGTPPRLEPGRALPAHRRSWPRPTRSTRRE